MLDRSDNNAPNQAMMFSNTVITGKKEFLRSIGNMTIEANITLDSPVPYNLNTLISALQAKDTEMVQGTRTEKQGPYHGKLTRFIQRLETKQADKRLNFMFSQDTSLLTYEYMNELCMQVMQPANSSVGGVKIIDFSEVPSDVLPLIVSLLARILFSVQTYKKLGKEACASHIIGEDVSLEIILTTIQVHIKSVVNAESVIKKTQQEIVKAKEKLFYSNKIKHIEDEIGKIGKLKRGLYEDYKEGIITLDEYNIMKSEYEKAYLKKRTELNVQKEYLEKIKERKYSGNKYIENFKKHKNIAELSREVILNLIDEVIVYKDKQIIINFKFKDEYKKMMSIIDTQ